MAPPPAAAGQAAQGAPQDAIGKAIEQMQKMEQAKPRSDPFAQNNFLGRSIATYSAANSLTA